MRALDCGGGLLQELQPLPTHVRSNVHEARGIAARASEARNDADGDWIAKGHKYNRDRVGLPKIFLNYSGLIAEDYVAFIAISSAANSRV